MDFTTRSFVVTTNLICLAVVVAALVVWPGKGRLRREWSMVATLAARLGTGLLIMLASVLAAAVTVNALLQGVTDWSGLVATLHDVGEPAPPDVLHAGGGAGLTHYDVLGSTSHYQGRVDVWVPPGFQATQRNSYPVIMALHGFPGHVVTVTKVLRAEGYAWEAVQQKGMRAPIIVIPEWSDHDLDTECTDFDAHDRVETWLTHDLVAWVHQQFPQARMGPENWATLGYSAGAYCSRMLAMRHPGVFGADIDLSGYSAPLWSDGREPADASGPQWRMYDMVQLARHTKPPVALYLVSDPTDRMSWPSTHALYLLRGQHLRAALVTGAGGDSPALWRAHLLSGYLWLGQTLKGFAPAPG